MAGQDKAQVNKTQDGLQSLVRPLWPCSGFCNFCLHEIRKGLVLRHWITLPAMWRRELRFRSELARCVNELNNRRAR